MTLGQETEVKNIELGPRPYYLVDQMEESELKGVLEKCGEGEFFSSDFSIGHRGAPLQFPEHTKESYVAAARMGAGILECDVTFTKDLRLVCRHSQCDLHTTTNILATPLAVKCSQGFTPAVFDEDGNLVKEASANCCTTDITYAEFKTLCGKMDASDPRATTVEDYLGGTENWRTDLYSTCGTLLSHAESIALFSGLGTKFIPELKTPTVEMPFNGFTREEYAQRLIDEYKDAGVDPKKVYAQSFNLKDVLYWIENEPGFGAQAVFLDGRYDAIDPADPSAAELEPGMAELAAKGINIIAPPVWVLLMTDGDDIIPSDYARAAKNAGLKIITWTTERSGRIVEDVLGAGDTFYYRSTLGALSGDGDVLVTLDVLARQVGVMGVFSDWPATTTYYANCLLGRPSGDPNGTE